MELRIPEQGLQFLWALASGLTIGLVYDLLWGLRQEIPRITHLGDLLTGVALLVINVLLLLYVGDGEYRIFFPIGTAVGFVLWRLSGSRGFRAGNRLFWRLFLFLPGKILVFLKKIIKKMKIFLKYPFSKRGKSVKIKGQHLSNGGESSG